MYVCGGRAERGGVTVQRGGMEGDAQPYYRSSSLFLVPLVGVYIPFCKFIFYEVWAQEKVCSKGLPRCNKRPF